MFSVKISEHLHFLDLVIPFLCNTQSSALGHHITTTDNAKPNDFKPMPIAL